MTHSWKKKIFNYFSLSYTVIFVFLYLLIVFKLKQEWNVRWIIT